MRTLPRQPPIRPLPAGHPSIWPPVGHPPVQETAPPLPPWSPGWRCLLVAAAAGYGKTTTVRRMLAPGTSRWYTRAEWTPVLGGTDGGPPQVDLSRLPGSTDGPAGDDRWLVLDGVDPLPPPRLRALLTAAYRLPDRVRLVVVTRRPPPTALVAGGLRRGDLGLLGPVDLALSRVDVAALLRDRYDLPDPALTRAVHRATAGWPVLVHLLARTLRDLGDRDDGPAGLAAAAAGAVAYLAGEVFRELPADAARVLRSAARVDPAHPELLAGSDPRRTGRLLRWLAAAGLLGAERTDGAGHPAIPLVTEAARRHFPLSPARAAALQVRAADWYAGRGLPAPALRGYGSAGRVGPTVRLLRRYGARLLADGEAALVGAAVGALPPARCPAPLRQLHGDALRIAGAAEPALEVYRSQAARCAALPPALAWRYGLVHLLRGEPLAAIAVFDRASAGAGRTPDEALLLAWAGCAYALSGDVATGRDRARRALAAASAVPGAGRLGEPAPARPPAPPGSVPPAGPDPPVGSALRTAQAVVTAAVAAGLTARLAGDRATGAGQLAEAVRLADAAGDLGLAAWARLNLAVAQSGAARYREAVTVAGEAVRLAEEAGYPAMLALALAVRGTALLRLGRLVEAVAEYERSVALHHRLGSAYAAVPLAGLGRVHLLCGRDSLARAAYQEAVQVSEPTGNVFALVPALAGLARVIAGTDPARATDLAERAVRLAPGPDGGPARCALGWVAVAGRDLPRAVLLAAEAEEHARLHQDRAGLAEALRLRAAATGDPSSARHALVEAGAILREAGAGVDADRVRVLLGRLPEASAEERIDAEVAAARLAEIEVVVPVPAVAAGTVAVRTLGRFEVRVDGRPVPTSAWQSRKARDLLRILAARQGRPVSREQLGELLWPGEPPERLGHRLSVLLSLLRGVLDPDRHGPVDRYVVAERASLALDVTHVDLDVRLFQAEALLGLRRLERGERVSAQDVLTLAEQRYLGDFLADDPYDDSALPVREEMRRLYLRVVRALALLARHRGDPEQAAYQLRRALEIDPYDERTHEELISVLSAAGRYGEADEAYRRYRRAMAVLGVPARLPR
ncbi:BTAD domain-containing putative transcriptional regulator [Plantactinospora sp. KLBMP9567]|uniref:BTAD domain-containing putative transcriptional regulator n=1 Tax=Plantactinospora sp. KLBMP9567 TaxID=3085900 RepID=UPI002981B4E1|nr:BTAD domain-containing putative transcriptional regulator [Plantactinospora sp. KLBMP9567]MDW5330233.1 BTAD domain-containing putative transcriptional regulator [Plantactinospora sp. KLBMP9567]